MKLRCLGIIISRFFKGKICHLQIQPKQIVRGITYVYTDRIFDRRLFILKEIFKKKVIIEVCSRSLCASLSTFCVKIGQFFEARRVFKHSEEFRNRRHFASM